MSHVTPQSTTGLSCSRDGKTTKAEKDSIRARHEFDCVASYKTGDRVSLIF